MTVKELVVDRRRGRNDVTVFFEDGVEIVVWKDGEWVDGSEATEDQKAAIRSLGTFLVSHVGKAKAAPPHEEG